MRSSGLQAQRGQDQHCPHALVRANGKAAGVVQLLGGGDAEDAEEALFDAGQKIEKPDCEGDVEVDEVGKTQHRQAQRNRLRGGVAEAGDAGLQIDIGYEVPVIVQRIEAADDKGQGKAKPAHISPFL